mmetsp:Transcript_2798/g.3957  ORF Transcript_2798/g.3957 Transcript_2798/m.3957 type:complete len:512 (+) Transcript_2798:338-1873(+)
MTSLAEIGSSILLYFLVFGMSATVELSHLRKQIRNRNALLTGISMQFVILPCLGFAVVKLLDMDAPMGISLLVVTSSPGGSYSNWWCSMFNADLALSVTMTAISTLLSTIMLPVNLIIYATTSYSSKVVASLDWYALFLSLVVVIGGIGTGLLCSAKINSPTFNVLANKLGNLAGIALVTYSVLVSSSGKNDTDSGGNGGQLWNQEPWFYMAIASPCIIGLMIATFITSRLNLYKPERVAVAVECCYQNTGIATSVAITMFQGDDLAIAISVPLFYGICEAVVLAFYCLGAWKVGWTKAPPSDPFLKVIAKTYEVETHERCDPNAIEIVFMNETTIPTSTNRIQSITTTTTMLVDEANNNNNDYDDGNDPSTRRIPPLEDTRTGHTNGRSGHGNGRIRGRTRIKNGSGGGRHLPLESAAAATMTAAAATAGDATSNHANGNYYDENDDYHPNNNRMSSIMPETLIFSPCSSEDSDGFILDELSLHNNNNNNTTSSSIGDENDVDDYEKEII